MPQAALCLAGTVALVCAVSIEPSAQVRTLTARPSPPEDVRAVKTGPGEVTITWEAVPEATEYQIGRLVPPAGWVRVTRVRAGTTRYVDGGRNLSSTHRYNVVTIAGAAASLPALSNDILPVMP